MADSEKPCLRPWPSPQQLAQIVFQFTPRDVGMKAARIGLLDPERLAETLTAEMHAHMARTGSDSISAQEIAAAFVRATNRMDTGKGGERA